MKPRCVYVIWRRDGAHKIGVSRDPAVRRMKLGLEAKQPTKLIYAVERATDAFRVESLAHEILGPELCLGREWFRANAEAAISAVTRACVRSDKITEKADALEKAWEENPALFDEWCSIPPKDLQAALRRHLREGINDV